MMVPGRRQHATGGSEGPGGARDGRSAPGAPVVNQPPLTPMIDVVFQLLLFFLLGCAFLPEEVQLPANLSGPGKVFLEPVRVVLHPAGQDDLGVIIEIAGLDEPVMGIPALYARLKRRIEVFGDDDAPVVIQPRGAVRWQHVVDAFHQAARAGYRKVSFAPLPG